MTDQKETNLHEYSYKYLIFLIIFLMLNEIFDTYTTLFWPVIDSFVITDFQITESLYALCITIASVGMYFVFINQAISDRIGRKPMLFIVLLGMGVTSLLLSLAQTIYDFTLFLFLLFIWFSSDIWIITISEECPEKHRGKIVNLILIAGAAPTLFIPVLRSLLVPNFGWRSMTWFAFLAIPVALLALPMKETRAYQALEEPLSSGISEKKQWVSEIFKPSQAKYQKYFLVIILLSFLTGVNYTFLSLGEAYLTIDRSFDIDLVSLIILMMGIAAIIGYSITAFLADYLGRKPTAILFISVMPLGIILVLIGSKFLVIIGAMVVSCSFWSLNVTSRLICLEHFPTSIRGTGNGWRSLFYAIGVTSGSFISSLLISHIGLGNVFLLLSLVLLICIPGIYFILKETKGINLTEEF
ncbi:MAG: MFS transporter [Promethearchaeota archaeon]